MVRKNSINRILYDEYCGQVNIQTYIEIRRNTYDYIF